MKILSLLTGAVAFGTLVSAKDCNSGCLKKLSPLSTEPSIQGYCSRTFPTYRKRAHPQLAWDPILEVIAQTLSGDYGEYASTVDTRRSSYSIPPYNLMSDYCSCVRRHRTPTTTSRGQPTTTPPIVTTTRLTTTTTTFTTTTSAGPAPAQRCPTQGICNTSGGGASRCSSQAGRNYNVLCSVEYFGTILNVAPMIKRQTTVGSFSDCQTLCDTTPNCIALNYQQSLCTLFSAVAGTRDTTADGNNQAAGVEGLAPTPMTGGQTFVTTTTTPATSAAASSTTIPATSEVSLSLTSLETSEVTVSTTTADATTTEAILTTTTTVETTLSSTIPPETSLPTTADLETTTTSTSTTTTTTTATTATSSGPCETNAPNNSNAPPSACSTALAYPNVFGGKGLTVNAGFSSAIINDFNFTVAPTNPCLAIRTCGSFAASNNLPSFSIYYVCTTSMWTCQTYTRTLTAADFTVLDPSVSQVYGYSNSSASVAA